MKTIYLANGLFNAGERLHNLYLEKHLILLGYKVILPQREALNFFKGSSFDLDALVTDCQNKCSDPNHIYVGCLDGTDADSGTAVEYGMAIATTKKAIVFRTDFRTELEKELGVNGMFYAKKTYLVYEPCFFTELNQVDDYYKKLAEKLHKAIEKITTTS